MCPHAVYGIETIGRISRSGSVETLLEIVVVVDTQEGIDNSRSRRLKGRFIEDCAAGRPGTVTVLLATKSYWTARAELPENTRAVRLNARTRLKEIITAPSISKARASCPQLGSGPLRNRLLRYVLRSVKFSFRPALRRTALRVFVNNSDNLPGLLAD